MTKFILILSYLILLLSNVFADAILQNVSGTTTLGAQPVCVSTNNGTLTANVLIGDGARGLVNGAASGAVPVNADGSATTLAQIGSLGQGPVLTNKNVNSFVLFTNNQVSLSFDSSGVFTLTNWAASGLGISWTTNGSQALSGNITFGAAGKGLVFSGSSQVDGGSSDLQFFGGGQLGRMSLMNRAGVTTTRTLGIGNDVTLVIGNNAAPESALSSPLFQASVNGVWIGSASNIVMDTSGNVTATGTITGNGAGVTNAWVKEVFSGGFVGVGPSPGAVLGQLDGYQTTSSPVNGTRNGLAPIGGYLTNLTVYSSVAWNGAGTNCVFTILTNTGTSTGVATPITCTLNPGGASPYTNSGATFLVLPTAQNANGYTWIMQCNFSTNIAAQGTSWKVEWWHQSP